ncbi:MAG: hypothetical protein F6K11_33795, partial [Leptolyngbya sp. SIO3F4]|nr:hypothetical protein [Leptolyngbya sp. SIO3F4]
MNMNNRSKRLKGFPIEKWIFVTGAIRSGTTFVGKILSLPLEVDYIHEPFNPQCGIPGVNLGHRYIPANLAQAESHPYHPLAQSIFNYSLTLKNFIPEADPLK